MNSKLPEEKLVELLPGLKRLAELVSAGELLDRREFLSITSEIGIDGGDWALDELEIWSQILIKHKGNPHAKEAIVTELYERGVPEFPAMLACDLAKPKPITVDPAFIDFGCLEIGDVVTKMITVSGEHIKKVECLGSRRLKITLLNKLGTTLVQVQASNGTAGEIIKDEIILQSNTSELRVSVAAHWAAEPPLLSWCPVCGPENINKKSLFYNKYDKRYECFRCKHEFPYSDKQVSEYNKTHKQ
jgi:hypothetical protein